MENNIYIRKLIRQHYPYPQTKQKMAPVVRHAVQLNCCPTSVQILYLEIYTNMKNIFIKMKM